MTVETKSFGKRKFSDFLDLYDEAIADGWRRSKGTERKRLNAGFTCGFVRDVPKAAEPAKAKETEKSEDKPKKNKSKKKDK